MIEKRTVLGYITHPVEGKREIAFPEVRAWLKASGEVDLRPGPDCFPNSGTVYLHASAAKDTLPLPDHYGLFECKPSNRARGSAAWEVYETDDSLSYVLRLCAPITRPLDLFRELESVECRLPAKVFLGSGQTYVLSADDWLIGPYTLKNDRLVPAERMMRWKGSSATMIDPDDGEHLFTCPRLLGSSFAFPSSLQDAAKRVLKLISKRGRCEFLSRPRISELATELANADFGEEHSWLVSGLSDLLPRLRDTLDLSNEASSMLLGSPEIAGLLDGRWRASHMEQIEQEESKLRSKSEALARTTEKHEALTKSLARLTHEEEKLSKLINGHRLAAQSAFNDEISRLASNPSQIAILSALFSEQQSPGQTVAPTAGWQKILCSPPDQGEESAHGPHEKQLQAIGLTPRCAREVAAVSAAAFLVGQVVCIRSPLAPIVADALFSGCGHEFYLSHEVPAGLLDPLSQPKEWGSPKTALLFNGANRSDYGLVLANIRNHLLRQLFVGCRPAINAILALDSGRGLVVDQPLPIGPCICGDFIQLADRPGSPALPATPFTEPPDGSLDPMSSDEFEALFLEPPEKLSALRDPFTLLMARRFCGSLKGIGNEGIRVKELFFKYWLIPRLGTAEAAKLLDVEASLRESDARLRIYLETISE